MQNENFTVSELFEKAKRDPSWEENESAPLRRTFQINNKFAVIIVS